MQSVVLFTLLFGCVVYLFMKYGKLQYEGGRTQGYNQGKFDGILYGMQEAFQFLEQLGVANLEEIETALNDGKFDHIGNIAENRVAAKKLMDIAKSK